MKRLTSYDGVWEEVEDKNSRRDVAESIMHAMGAELAVIVKKRRRSGCFGEIEVQIDEVEKLGTYLEIAVQVDKEFGRARNLIDKLLCELHIPADRVELRGYPVILLERQGVSFSAR